MSELHEHILRHACGRGISPVPTYGAGFFDKLKGFGRWAYNLAAPAVQQAGKTIARDVLSDLNKRVVSI